MLMDHGCDALTTCTISLSVTRIVGLSKFWQAYALSLCILLFFLANLEQYYTHYLYLPKINAVSEGTWGLALLCIITGFLGSDVWLKSPLGVPNNTLLLVGFTLLAAGTLFYHSKKILGKTNKTEYFLKVRFSLAFCLLVIFLHLCKPSLYTYTFMYVLTFSVSKVTILCQLSHVTATEFNPLRFTNIGLLGFTVLIFVLALFRMDVSGFMNLLFVVAFADFANFTFIISTRLAKLLDINIFTVGPASKPNDQSPGVQIGSPSLTNLEEKNFKKIDDDSGAGPQDTA